MEEAKKEKTTKNILEDLGTPTIRLDFDGTNCFKSVKSCRQNMDRYLMMISIVVILNVILVVS